MKVKARLLNLEEEHTRLLAQIENNDKEVFGLTRYLFEQLDAQQTINRDVGLLVSNMESRVLYLEDCFQEILRILQERTSD